MLKEIFLVATPIGDLDDITLKALRTLADADTIIVEEIKTAKKLFDLLKIKFTNKKIYELNEHNEKKKARAIIEEIIIKSRQAALVSEAGLPVIADPGSIFVREALAFGLELKHIGGSCSITAALQVSGISAETFYFAGFLPRRENLRIRSLEKLKTIRTSLIIMETPYRLPQILGAIRKTFGAGRRLAICFNLTTAKEFIFRGTVKEATARFKIKKKNSPFVIVIDNNDYKRNSKQY